MIHKSYSDFGLFDSKEEALKHRNKRYKWCSYALRDEKGKKRLYVKVPK